MELFLVPVGCHLLNLSSEFFKAAFICGYKGILGNVYHHVSSLASSGTLNQVSRACKGLLPERIMAESMERQSRSS